VTAVALQQSDLESARVASRTYVSRRRASKVDAATIICVMIALLTLFPARYIVPGMTDLGRPALIVGLLIFAWWVTVRFTPHLVLPGPQPIRWALLAFAVSMLVSYAVGQLRGLTTMEANGADRALLFLAIFAGTALGAADGIANMVRLNRVLTVLVACGAVMALIGLIQFAFSYDLTAVFTIPGLESKREVLGVEERGGGVRVASTATHYIELATVLATILPFGIHQAMFATTRRRRRLAILASALLAAGVLTTISRSGILAIVIVVLVLVPAWNWRQRYNFLAFATILAGALTIAKPGLVRTISRLFDDPSNNPAFTVRQERYPLVWYYVSQRPWLGRGTGTYLAPQYQILDNQWLAFLISNGIVGVVAILAMHITAIAAAVAARRRAATDELRHLCTVLVSTQLIALAVAGTYDSMSFLTYAILVALTLGLCGTVWRLTHPSEQVRTATPRWFVDGPASRFMRHYIRPEAPAGRPASG
jgi:O-antigen ligase